MFTIQSRVLTMSLLALWSLNGCTQETRTKPVRETTPPKGETQMKLTSSAFQNGQPISKKYSGEGDDISPRSLNEIH